MKKILGFLLFCVLLYGAKLHYTEADSDFTRKDINSNVVYSYNKAVEEAKHSVVNISTKKKVKIAQTNPFNFMFNDPFFRQFFGNNFFNHRQMPQERLQRALGSGVIISKDGYIVTNAHVVKEADEITVSLGDNPDVEYDAKLIGIDVDSDLAVIKIKAKEDLKPIKLGDSSRLKIGDLVFAIGNPFGIGQTVTHGIVSALNKSNVGINRYENFIQTDAPINPGNSGGALIDSRGVLVGINSAIITRSGGNNGIGFAIPVNMVKIVVTKLVEHGKVVRGYLGVSIGNLNKNLKKVYKHKKGAVIIDVVKDSPADKFGLKRGDLVYQVNNKKIKNANELSIVIGSFNPGDKISLYIERDKENMIKKVKLANKDEFLQVSSNKAVLGGLYLSDITNRLRKQFQLSATIKGVVVTKVKDNSSAFKAKILPGDVIIQVENYAITSLNDMNKVLKKYKNQYKRIYFSRYGNIFMIALK